MVRTSGVYAQLFYHFVWTTKNREPIIDAECETALNDIIRSKAVELNLDIVEVGGTEDHIHVLLQANQTISPSTIAKHLKGVSSHFINHRLYVDTSSKSFYWQDGYGVVSVSPRAVSTVARYVRNQKEHHRTNDLDSDLEHTEDL
ncbi:MAG: IS200/IS605 family transposase [Ignavibacteriales bacterium]|nr:IS200/IS605 family transposase [Ignavibacteriales bacterium]